MTVEEAAAQLAQAIKQSDSWVSFQAASREFEDDRMVSSMFDEYRRLMAELQQAHSQGQPPSAEEAGRLEHLQATIQASPVYQKRESAADGMIAQLVAANTVVSNELGFDFAVNAAPPKNGSCCGSGHGQGGGGGCGCG